MPSHLQEQIRAEKARIKKIDEQIKKLREQQRIKQQMKANPSRVIRA